MYCCPAWLCHLTHSTNKIEEHDLQPHVLLRWVNILFGVLEIWPKKSFSDIKRCGNAVAAPTKPSELTCKTTLWKWCKTFAAKSTTDSRTHNQNKQGTFTAYVNEMKKLKKKIGLIDARELKIHGQQNALQRILYPTMYCSLTDPLFPTATIFKHIYFAKSIFKQNWIKIHLFLRWWHATWGEVTKI